MVTKLISLKKDEYRRTVFFERWKQFSKTIEWSPAVDGNNISEVESTLKNLGIKGPTCLPRYYSGHRGKLSTGELGCTLSHLNAINEFLLSSEEFMLVLEDDAEPNDLPKIETIVQSIDRFDFDIFLIGFRKNTQVYHTIKQLFWKLKFTLRIWWPRPEFDTFLFNSMASWKAQRLALSHGNPNGIKINSSGFHYGTFAYIINRRAAAELRHHLASLQLRSDEAITWLNMTMRLKVITSESHLVSVDPQHKSNIRSSLSQKQSFNQYGT